MTTAIMARRATLKANALAAAKRSPVRDAVYECELDVPTTHDESESGGGMTADDDDEWAV